jgi:hypothetical protein
MKHLILTLLSVGLISAHAEVTKDNFGITRDGESVERYTLKNKHGLAAKVITLGGIITELHVPDRAGKLADIALGFDTVAEYEEHNGGVFFGCPRARGPQSRRATPYAATRDTRRAERSQRSAIAAICSSRVR